MLLNLVYKLVRRQVVYIRSILVITYAASVNLSIRFALHVNTSSAVKSIMVLSKTKQKLRVARLANKNKPQNKGKNLTAL